MSGGDGGKGIGIEIWLSRPVAAEYRDRGKHLIGGLRIAWRIERRRGGTDAKRGSAFAAENPIGLPAAGERGAYAVVQHASCPCRRAAHSFRKPRSYAYGHSSRLPSSH